MDSIEPGSSTDVSSSEARLQSHAVEAMRLPLRYEVTLLLLFLPTQRSAFPFPCNCKQGNKGYVTEQSRDQSRRRWMVLRSVIAKEELRLCTSQSLAVVGAITCFCDSSYRAFNGQLVRVQLRVLLDLKCHHPTASTDWVHGSAAWPKDCQH